MTCWESVAALKNGYHLSIEEARAEVEYSAAMMELRLIRIDRDELRIALDAYGWFGWVSVLHAHSSEARGFKQDIRPLGREIARVRRYAFDYGDGGWEGRLKGVFSRHLGDDLSGGSA